MSPDPHSLSMHVFVRVYTFEQLGGGGVRRFVAHFLVSCCCARHSSVEGILTCHSVMPVSLSGSTWPLSPSALLSKDSAWSDSPDNVIKIFLHQQKVKEADSYLRSWTSWDWGSRHREYKVVWCGDNKEVSCTLKHCIVQLKIYGTILYGWRCTFIKLVI